MYEVNDGFNGMHSGDICIHNLKVVSSKARQRLSNISYILEGIGVLRMFLAFLAFTFTYDAIFVTITNAIYSSGEANSIYSSLSQLTCSWPGCFSFTFVNKHADLIVMQKIFGRDNTTVVRIINHVANVLDAKKSLNK